MVFTRSAGRVQAVCRVSAGGFRVPGSWVRVLVGSCLPLRVLGCLCVSRNAPGPFLFRCLALAALGGTTASMHQPQTRKPDTRIGCPESLGWWLRSEGMGAHSTQHQQDSFSAKQTLAGTGTVRVLSLGVFRVLGFSALRVLGRVWFDPVNHLVGCLALNVALHSVRTCGPSQRRACLI